MLRSRFHLRETEAIELRGLVAGKLVVADREPGGRGTGRGGGHFVPGKGGHILSTLTLSTT
jgi:hypothetical protein